MLKRFITAAILIPIVITLVFNLPERMFALVTAAVFLYASFEWCSLTGVTNMWVKFFYLIFLAAIFLISGLISHYWVLIIGVAWWLFIVKNLFTLKDDPQSYAKDFFANNWSGPLVFTPCWLGLNILFLYGGPIWVLISLCVVWGSDTMAYIIGKFFGKTKLAVKISPKKTREGVFGALITSIIIGVVFGIYLRLQPLEIALLTIVCLLSSAAVIVGDLYESFLKRIVGLKDSGNLLPGHGGLLDRIDGMLAAIPVFTLGVLILRLI